MPVWLELVLRVLAVVVAFLTLPLIVGQAEHKVMAHMQGRLGPMYAGAFHGWAQLIADGVKFAQKEDVTPRSADRAVFRLAPVVSLSLSGIVAAWRPWWLIWQLPAMVVFFTAGLAEIRRPPFDMPIADSELVFGYLTEYTGLRFAFFLLAEYVGIVVVAALTTVLFLGGWKGPFADPELGWLWTLLKVFAVSFVIIWVRVAYPRLREDQLQRLCWLGRVPLGVVQPGIPA